MRFTALCDSSRLAAASRLYTRAFTSTARDLQGGKQHDNSGEAQCTPAWSAHGSPRRKTQAICSAFNCTIEKPIKTPHGEWQSEAHRYPSLSEDAPTSMKEQNALAAAFASSAFTPWNR